MAAKTRGLGRAFLPKYRDKKTGEWKESALYWIQYGCRRTCGDPDCTGVHREPTGSPNRADAVKMLKRRHGEVSKGRLVSPDAERVTFEELASDYLKDYEVRGLRSIETAAIRVKHLKAFFAGKRAVDLTADRIRAYQAHRLDEDADPGTVNRETAALRRMFTLALKAGRLSVIPFFPERLEENPARSGFFEHHEYLAIRKHLSPDYQDVLDFAYHSGWRRREITGLTWAEVDIHGGVIRLSPDRSKTKTTRLLPLSQPLREILTRRLKARRLDTPLVFHYGGGAPIRDWRKSWVSACKAAGLSGKRLHDCRRTVARNLIRSGVPETVAMRLIGHKTRAMLDRYNIVNERDLQEGAARLAEYVAAQPTERTVVPLPSVAKRSSR